MTDLSGRETRVRITGGMKVKADRDESLHRICRYACCTKCRLAMQEDVTPIPNDSTRRKGGRRGEFFFWRRWILLWALLSMFHNCSFFLKSFEFTMLYYSINSEQLWIFCYMLRYSKLVLILSHEHLGFLLSYIGMRLFEMEWLSGFLVCFDPRLRNFQSELVNRLDSSRRS